MATQLIIQSKDREHGTPNDFHIEIPTFRRDGYIVLLSASIPNTLYNVDGKNHTISWSRGGVPYTTTIPHGAYGITNFVLALTAAFGAADPGASYQVVYSEVTMKLTILCDAPISLSLASVEGHLWSVMGFAGTNTSPALSHTGSMVVRLDFPSHLYIDIGLPGAATANTSWFSSNFAIPMTNISQYVEVYNRAVSWDQYQHFSVGSGRSYFRIRLYKPDGTLAETNGAEWSMTIGLECP